jgi:glucose-1-phosphate thymidylyltransferase
MPVYDKPMIYYPISTLLAAGIKDILLITTPEDKSRFKKLLGDGSAWGVHFDYISQAKPEGLAQAFILAEEFINEDNVALILGDNLFYGHDLVETLTKAAHQTIGATIFGYHVANPSDYGVVEFNKLGKVISIKEKPKYPKSNYAIPGLYFFDNQVVEFAKKVKPSLRGELEITDVIEQYQKNNSLNVEVMGRGTAWLDTGTHDSLLDATMFIAAIEKRQGLKICCPEEIAFRMNYITASQLKKLAFPLKKSGYGQYLLDLLKNTVY